MHATSSTSSSRSGSATRPASSSASTKSPSPRNGELFRRLRFELDVVLDTHQPDHIELLLDEIDVLLLVLQDVREELPADVVPHGFGMGDAVPQIPYRLLLELQVAVQDLIDGFADQQLVEILEVGQAAEEQDPLDQP